MIWCHILIFLLLDETCTSHARTSFGHVLAPRLPTSPPIFHLPMSIGRFKSKHYTYPDSRAFVPSASGYLSSTGVNDAALNLYGRASPALPGGLSGAARCAFAQRGVVSVAHSRPYSRPRLDDSYRSGSAAPCGRLLRSSPLGAPPPRILPKYS